MNDSSFSVCKRYQITI